MMEDWTDDRHGLTATQRAQIRRHLRAAKTQIIRSWEITDMADYSPVQNPLRDLMREIDDLLLELR